MVRLEGFELSTPGSGEIFLDFRVLFYSIKSSFFERIDLHETSPNGRFQADFPHDCPQKFTFYSHLFFAV